MNYLRVKGPIMVYGPLHKINMFYERLKSLNFPIVPIVDGNESRVHREFEFSHRVTEWHKVQLVTIAQEFGVRLKNF